MQGTLMFTKPDDVVPDEERPGLLRALTNEAETGDVHVLELHDLSTPETTEPGLEAAGFETIGLAGNTALQHVLAQVLEHDYLTEADAAAIRESLNGTELSLANGKHLRIELVVEDGLYLRRSGPRWLNVNPNGMDGANGHGGASYVHGDQDVFGTPLRQIMHGEAPNIFRHITPDGQNTGSTTLMLNLWIPLHAPVQPLALMDRRSLDSARHQLRYGLPVDGFLDRDDDASINDIWNFLYDNKQRWYITSNMGPGQGYVFDTLGTPHGAAILPGEDALANIFVALQHACEAFDRGDATALASLTIDDAGEPPSTDAPPAIRDAWQQMAELIGQAAAGDEAWVREAQAAMSSVIRRSVELRLIATLIDP